jgi:hypothetical protein
LIDGEISKLAHLLRHAVKWRRIAGSGALLHRTGGRAIARRRFDVRRRRV